MLIEIPRLFGKSSLYLFLRLFIYVVFVVSHRLSSATFLMKKPFSFCDKICLRLKCWWREYDLQILAASFVCRYNSKYAQLFVKSYI